MFKDTKISYKARKYNISVQLEYSLIAPNDYQNSSFTNFSCVLRDFEHQDQDHINDLAFRDSKIRCEAAQYDISAGLEGQSL